MSEQLDNLVRRLASAPTDRSLDQLETRVSRGIVRRRAQARISAALAPVGLASVGLSLAMGLAVGGVTAAAASPRNADALSVMADLSPSTLLEGAR